MWRTDLDAFIQKLDEVEALELAENAGGKLQNARKKIILVFITIMILDC